MGVDTNVLLTGAPDVLDVLCFLHETYGTAQMHPARTTPDDRWWIIRFKDGEDARVLSVFPPGKCAIDYADVHVGPAVLISMGCWGNSEIIGRRLCAKFGGLLMAEDSVGEWVALPKARAAETTGG